MSLTQKFVGACWLMSMGLIDARALQIELREDVWDVGCESPGLLKEGILITPRRLEIVLTAIEVRKEEVHSLHKTSDLLKLPVSAVSWPLDDEV